jgi:hypothetical protein
MGDLALAERFRGCMVGALVGDCLGAHFECRHENLVPPSLLDNFFGELERQDNSIKRQVSFYLFTVLTLSVRLQICIH